MNPPERNVTGHWIERQFSAKTWARVVAFTRHNAPARPAAVEVTLVAASMPAVTLYFRVNETFNLSFVNRKRFRVVREGRRGFSLEVLRPERRRAGP